MTPLPAAPHRPPPASPSRGSSSSVTSVKSVPLGKCWRRSPLVFSLAPRCQGECGSQKHALTPVASAKERWAAISQPWSQVGVLASAAGTAATISAGREATAWLARASRRDTRDSLEDLSTRVARQLRPSDPTTRSPSRWPGTARPSAPAGRSETRSPPPSRGRRGAAAPSGARGPRAPSAGPSRPRAPGAASPSPARRAPGGRPRGSRASPPRPGSPPASCPRPARATGPSRARRPRGP